MSTLTRLADAIVAELATGQFDQAFEPVMSHQPKYSLEDLQELRVTVVPKSQTLALAARVGCFLDCEIDIGIQKKVDAQDRVTVDAMLDLVEQVMDYLKQRELKAMSDAAWLSIKNDPPLQSEHLDQLGVFTSIVTVGYRMAV